MFTPILKGLMLYSCYFYSFTCTGVLYDFNIRWCSFRIKGKRGMSLLEQIVYIPHHPEHLSLPLVLCRFHAVQSLVFCAVFYISQFVFLSASLWLWYCLSFTMYGFWLLLWCQQTFHAKIVIGTTGLYFPTIYAFIAY